LLFDMLCLFAAKVVGAFSFLEYPPTGKTENVADLIAAKFGDDAEGPFEIEELQGSIAEKFAGYNALVVGTAMCNVGVDSERSGSGWDEVYNGEMHG
jgi:flavodoxin